MEATCNKAKKGLTRVALYGSEIKKSNPEAAKGYAVHNYINHWRFGKNDKDCTEGNETIYTAGRNQDLSGV